MSIINFSDAAPAAGPGTFNVSWQNDLAGDLSAMYTIPPLLTSVALNMPSDFVVTGSPITPASGSNTGSGAFQVTRAPAHVGWVLAGPAPGPGVVDGPPTFRQLTPADMPTGTGLGSVTSVGLQPAATLSELSITVTGVGAQNPITGSGVFVINKTSQPAATVWAGPLTGVNAAPTFRALAASDLSPWYPPLTYSSGAGVTTLASGLTASFNGSTLALTFPTVPNYPTFTSPGNLVNFNTGVEVTGGNIFKVVSLDGTSFIQFNGVNGSQPPIISSSSISGGQQVIQCTSLFEVINSGGLAAYASDKSSSVNISCANSAGDPNVFSSTGKVLFNGQVVIVGVTNLGLRVASSNLANYIDIYTNANANPVISTSTGLISLTYVTGGSITFVTQNPSTQPIIFNNYVGFQSGGGIGIVSPDGRTTLGITCPNGGDPYINITNTGGATSGNVNFYPKLSVINQLVVETAVGSNSLVVTPGSPPAISTTGGVLNIQGNLLMNGSISSGALGSAPLLAAASATGPAANQICFYLTGTSGAYHLWVDYAGGDGIPHQAQLF